MVRVTVEMVPFGEENLKKVIASGEIVLSPTDNPEKGHYRYTFTMPGQRTKPTEYIGEIKGFHRDELVLALVKQCLEAANV